jgi:hypothetical protein
LHLSPAQPIHRTCRQRVWWCIWPPRASTVGWELKNHAKLLWNK